MDKDALNEIHDRFDRNTKRVTNVLEVFNTIKERGQKKRTNVGHSERGATREQERDLLRCAVVFLNMSLEDLLRSLQMQHVKEFLSGAMPKPKPRSKEQDIKHYQELEKASVAFNEIRAFKESGRSRFDDFLTEMAGAYVERYFSERNFSTIKHAENVLEFLGIDGLVKRSLHDDYGEAWDALKDDIGIMMKRRHHIVHKGDKSEKTRRGVRKEQNISKKLVEAWQHKVENLAGAIIKALE